VPIPTHFRFTVRGVFKNTPEQWSFGFHMSRSSETFPDAGLDDIDEGGVTAALTAFIQSGVFDSSVRVVDWRAYVIGTDNKMEGNGPLLHEVTPADIDGTASVRYPSQIAAVVTLVADNRGPARFGRFYLPGPAYQLESDRRISTTNADTIATSATTFLKAVSDSIDAPFTESVKGVNVSLRGGGGAGTLQQIDHVEVGRVYDTLRTRRNQLLEERQVGGQIDW